MRILAAWILMLGMAGILSAAQSLPEVARQERARRGQATPPERTITTEKATAGRSGAGVSVVGSRPAPPEAETGEVPAEGEAAPDAEAGEATPDAGTDQADTTEGEPDSGAPGLGEDEESWRAAFAEAREKIRRAEGHVALAETELVDLNNQLLIRSDIYNREMQVGALIGAKREELEGARQEVADSNRVLEQLYTDLRQSGLPAGWGR